MTIKIMDAIKLTENEIEKQIKSMPGQEKMVMEYYQKNPSAVASLRGALYEEKILDLIKTTFKIQNYPTPK